MNPSSVSRPSTDWRKFAAATGAALAATTAADASIVYTKPASPIDLQLANNPADKTEFSDKTFKIHNLAVTALMSHHPLSSAPAFDVGQAGIGAVKIKFFALNSASLKAFAYGQAIAGARATGLANLDFYNQKSHKAGGQFAFGQTAFVGFKTTKNDLGWIRVEVLDRNNDKYPDELRVIDWAYNSTANAAINAGQGGPAPVPAPEPSTNALALLALGSAGVLAWRKRQKAEGGRQKAENAAAC